MSRNQQILNLFRERKSHALRQLSPFLQTLAKRYDLYRGGTRNPFAAGYNNVWLPSTLSIIQADVSKKMQALFGGTKIVEFQPRNSTDGTFARKVTALVNAQLHDCDTPVKAQDFLLTADMYGTAFARHGWKTVRRYEQFRKMDEENQRELVAEGIVTRFDGPDWDVLDPLDVWPQPGRKRLKDCRWVLVRYFMDLDELKVMADVGVYDKSEVAALGRGPGQVGFINDLYNVRRHLYRNQSDFNARQNEAFNKVIECVDMFGYVPDEMAPDGFTFRMITVANDVAVIRNKPFPFWHGEIPILSYTPMADPHYIHGVGKIEVVEKLQYLANRWMSQKADAIDQTLRPMWLVNRLAGIDTQNLFTRAGGVIGADGPVDDSVIRQLMPDLRGLPLAESEIRTLWMWMQQGTGMIEDTMMGAQSSREQTATEYGGRAQAVMSRQNLELMVAGKLWVEPLANTIHSYNRQFLQLPREVSILGEDAEIDPITGLMVPPTMQEVALADLNKDYRAVAVGLSDMLGKQARRADIMALTGLMQQIPAAGMALNWVSWLRYVMTQFDLPNTKDFFNMGEVPGLNIAAQALQEQGSDIEGLQNMAGGQTPLVNLMMGGLNG